LKFDHAAPVKAAKGSLNEQKVARYGQVLGHVETDKPVYKQGDTLFAQVYLLNPLSKEPLLKRSLQAKMEVQDARNITIFSSNSSISTQGTVSFTYSIPSNQSGGEY